MNPTFDFPAMEPHDFAPTLVRFSTLRFDPEEKEKEREIFNIHEEEVKCGLRSIFDFKYSMWIWTIELLFRLLVLLLIMADNNELMFMLLINITKVHNFIFYVQNI